MVAQVDHRFIRLSVKKSVIRYLSYIFYEGRPLTTKGRWINPLVFLLYRLQAVLPFEKPVTEPVFIIGTGRSGTTILGITLAMHDEVGFLNEPKALWSYLFGKEDLIGSYQKTPGRYRLFADDADESTIKKAHRIFGNYLRLTCSSRVVDKYPEMIFRIGFVKRIFPDAKFLFLYRNGGDTCHSIRYWSERLGIEDRGEKHDWWGRDDRKWRLLCEEVVAFDNKLAPYIDEISQFSNHEHRAAVEWIVTMKEGMMLLETESDCVMGVKYEDYVSSQSVRRNVLKYCALQPDTRYDQYCKAVLVVSSSNRELDLPLVIRDEFTRVSQKLGYE